MYFKKFSSLAFFLSVFALLASCGGGGGGTDDATSDNGAAPSASARTTPITVGDSDCPNGGVLVESGIDENKNGLLDDNEVDDSQKVCNGLDSHNSLISLNDEPAGANCSYAGVRIDSGLDTNDNATLDNSEINNTGYVCNQVDGSIGWQLPTLVELDATGDASSPQIDFDANGNAMAVWRQWDGTQFSIWANRYQQGSGWGTAELIEVDNSGHASEPQVVFDTTGNALAVWYQSAGAATPTSIWTNTYVSGIGWGTAKLMEADDAGDARYAQIDSDANGNAIAVWSQSDGTRSNIWASTYLAGVGWGSPELIESDNAGNATRPQIAFDPNGNALVVWTQSDGTRYNVWANRYQPGSGWGTAELIETDNAGLAYRSQVAIDAAGNALAVWYQSDGVRHSIWSNRYTAGAGWGTAELIESDNQADAYYPQVSFDANGNAMAVWHQIEDGNYNIWSNYYTVGSGWGSEKLVETNNAGEARNPQVSFDANGNALAVWYQSDGVRNNIVSNRYIMGAGWGNVELVETDNIGDAVNPQIKFAANGNAMSVWTQSDGVNDNIYANFWVAP